MRLRDWWEHGNRFSWRGSRDIEVTKQDRRVPSSRDLSESFVVNSELTKGIFYNSYPGLKLAGALGYAPIAHPVSFMGLPTPKSEDAATQEALDKLVLQMSGRMPSMHISVSREGTLWAWPRFDAKRGRVTWELIPDDSISDLLKSPDLQETVEVRTDEEFKVSLGEGQIAYARRKRRFTESMIYVNWTEKGGLQNSLMDRSSKNVIGILPIAFANMREVGDDRGHSDYERLLYDLKDYHDIDLARSQILVKFKPKMVQEVTDVEKWLANNGYDSLQEIDPWSVDFVVNVIGKEKTTFETANGATDAYETALVNKYWKVVEGSGIPEIFWGLQAAGNQASVDDQRQAMVRYVEGKREQLNESYYKLFQASLELMSVAGMGKFKDFTMGWNRLSAASEMVKSTIFRNFATGVAAMASNRCITEEQLYNLWKENYPDSTEKTFKEFQEHYRLAASSEKAPEKPGKPVDPNTEPSEEDTPGTGMETI